MCQSSRGNTQVLSKTIGVPVIIRKYADLTTPTPAYGGKVWHAFSPKAWVHVLVDINTGKLERLDGVTGVLKKAVDKSVTTHALGS